MESELELIKAVILVFNLNTNIANWINKIHTLNQDLPIFLVGNKNNIAIEMETNLQ
jgi:GTPase SAR1 family protein